MAQVTVRIHALRHPGALTRNSGSTNKIIPKLINPMRSQAKCMCFDFCSFLWMRVRWRSWKPRRATKLSSGAHIRVSEIEIDTTAIWVHKNQIYENEIKLSTPDEQIWCLIIFAFFLSCSNTYIITYYNIKSECFFLSKKRLKIERISWLRMYWKKSEFQFLSSNIQS